MHNIFLAHERVVTPFTFSIFIGWIIYGVIIMISSFIPSWSPDPSLMLDPWFLEFIIGFFISFGSALSLIADWKWKNITTSWLLDKTGMLLSIGGWGGYAIGVALVDPTRAGAITLGLMAFFGLCIRLITTYSYERFQKYNIHLTKVRDKLWELIYKHSCRSSH